MKQSQAKKRDNAMTNKIFDGVDCSRLRFAFS